MPSIVVTQQPVYGRNLIQINWSDLPSVTFARVNRIDSFGVSTPVRVHTFTDSTGWQIELSGGLATLYDTDAPMDVPLYYTTTSTQNVATASTAQAVLGSGNDMWLKDPLRPWADQRVTQKSPDAPGCLPEGGIYFAGIDPEQRPNRSRLLDINDARLPIPVNRKRGAVGSNLGLVSRRFVDRDALVELNQSGNTLQLQTPAQYGIGNPYLWIGDYEVARLSSDHKVEFRTHKMQYVEVGRPTGLAEGVVGNRWLDLCDKYATFGAATAAGISWTDVLLGQAANPPMTAGFRLYSDIPIDFATYGAIPAGNRTYEDLMEDR